MDQKIFIDKDAEGRERRVTAKRVDQRGDAWTLHYKQPDGMEKIERIWGGHQAVEIAAVNLLSNYRLEFDQARQRGDTRKGMQFDRSVAVPDDGPIGYGNTSVKR